MSGSIKWFDYTTDGGDVFGIRMDESNGELVGNTDTGATPGSIYALPSNIKPRTATYISPDGRTRREVVITEMENFQTLAGSLDFQVVGGTITLNLAFTRGEVLRRITGTDTGLDDGDDT